MRCGYVMIRWPIFAIPIALALVERYDRLQEFTFAFALALIATTIASAFVPAIGVFHHLGLDPEAFRNLHPLSYLDELRALPPVREGSHRVLDLFGLTGLVTFPSFHAASALLYTWALWPARWMRPVPAYSRSRVRRGSSHAMPCWRASPRTNRRTIDGRSYATASS